MTYWQYILNILGFVALISTIGFIFLALLSVKNENKDQRLTETDKWVKDRTHDRDDHNHA